MMKWCLLLVISCVFENAHQFPSDDKGIYRYSASEEVVVDETSFHLCQNILRQIIDRDEHGENTYEMLQEIDAHVNYWLFDKGMSGSNHSCKTESQETPLVHISWNSRQNNCVNLGVFNDNGTPNFTEYICDLNINPSNVEREFTDLNFNSETIIESSAKTKRSLTRKVIQSYVDLAREIESTECSSPILNVYFNKTLVFSNASGDVGEEAPIDTIEVHINLNASHFNNSIPAMTKKQYFIHKNPVSFYKAYGDCSRQGKELVSIENKEETDDVVAAMNNNQIPKSWTSGHKLGPNHWHWHGIENNIDYTNWLVPEKSDNDKGDYCIEVDQQGGTWTDQDCGSKLPFICQTKVVSKAVEIPPTINILVDGNLVYELLPSEEFNKDQSNIVEVKIEQNGNAVNDQSTKFLVLEENSPQEAASEQGLEITKNLINSKFNGIDIRIEHSKQKGLTCQKEKFYHVHTEKKLSYIDAQQFCQNRSTQLVSIQNKRQQLDIEEIMLNLNIHHYYWTSGYLAADGVTWLWNENEIVTYSNWAKGEPNKIGSNEKCIELFVAGKTVKWNDQDCQDKNLIICETLTEPYWRKEKN